MNKKSISSVNNETIKQVKKIINKGHENLFVIEGKNIINEAIKNNIKIIQIFELNDSNCYQNSIKITDNVLKSITTTTHPEGFVALCQKPQINKVSKNIVFCDNVQDPGNIGTIIRTAVAFGYDTIYTNVNVYNPKIIRSTQGAIFKIKIVKINESESFMKELVKNYPIYITSLDVDSKDFNTINYPDKKVIVIGNEGHGVDKNLYKYATSKIHIPIDFESLNVSVATGIILNKARGKNEW